MNCASRTMRQPKAIKIPSVHRFQFFTKMNVRTITMGSLTTRAMLQDIRTVPLVLYALRN